MVTNLKQAPSWINPYGDPKQKNLVGQIYFPYAKFVLDQGDKASLDFLVAHFHVFAVVKSILLRFEGHCDSRGRDAANIRLAQQRANAVQAYVNSKTGDALRPLLTSWMVSHGERFASGRKHELDRRVDIIASYVPKPVTIVPPVVEGKPPVKMVRRPVQFLMIELIPVRGKIHRFIIVEKYQNIPFKDQFPCDMRQTKGWQHMDDPQGFLFPGVGVSRNVIKWREKKSSDTKKKVAEAFLNYLRALADLGGEDFDFSERIPKLKRGYRSWADYKARGDGNFLKYEKL